MIIFTRLGGGPVAVNPDLIERAEANPDTVMTMIGGHRFVVVESLQELVELVREWRASVTVAARRLEHLSNPGLTGNDAEHIDDDLAAQRSGGVSIARVLQLPPREG